MCCSQICVVPSDSARITRAQVSDSATYTCIASNRAGVDNRHYNLQVHGESEDVTRSCSSSSHRDNNEAYFSCCLLV